MDDKRTQAAQNGRAVPTGLGLRSQVSGSAAEAVLSGICQVIACARIKRPVFAAAVIIPGRTPGRRPVTDNRSRMVSPRDRAIGTRCVVDRRSGIAGLRQRRSDDCTGGQSTGNSETDLPTLGGFCSLRLCTQCNNGCQNQCRRGQCNFPNHDAILPNHAPQRMRTRLARHGRAAVTVVTGCRFA